MSAQQNALSLHEILLSLADSLNKAQNQLRSMPPYDEYGRPNTIYQLPYLDFNLEVVSEFGAAEAAAVAIPELPGGPILGPPDSRENPGGGSKVSSSVIGRPIRFVPLTPSDYSKAGTSKITSVISGRFVAVLPNEGLQQVFVSTTATLVEPDPAEPPVDYVTYRIVVRLQNATGATVENQRVEVNFDEQTTLSINGEELGDAPVFTSPKDGFTGTGENSGLFAVTVQLGGTDYEGDKTFIFTANSGNIFSSVAISKP